MTTNNYNARRLFSLSLLAAFGVTIAACGGDDKETPTPPAVDAGGKVDSSVVAEEDASTPEPGATCEEKVYAELSDGCAACVCGVDPAVAPSCQKPCWDFFGCAFVAQAGKCAQFAAGGEAMRKQLDECIGAECAAQLAVPGSMVASAYKMIIGACAVPMGGTPGACTADVGKFAAAAAK